ncbi:uncharacterized protein LOC119087423 [Peromyscus leucopus]|uniref:uncharacterized protein LOC119087423 n=1 Tax=Peromyscus leucopus TaxID=10041 RepID=UPI00188534D1|nr:uncharacterized protein LOC119087423 [Peromyscus leucopus]
MFSDSGRVEEPEEPQKVNPEPLKDQRENPGDSQPGPCTPPNAPVETSQLASAQRQVQPTCDEAVMNPESCSTPKSQVEPTSKETVMASKSKSKCKSKSKSKSLPQNSRANLRKDTPFQLGESSETVAMNQQGVPADQTKSPAGSQLMKLNTQETSLSGSQGRAVSGSMETVQTELGPVEILSGRETSVTYSAALCESLRRKSCKNQDVLSESQPASPEGSHVRSFSGEHTRDEAPVVTSVLDQTSQEEHHQERPVSGDQTSDSNQSAPSSCGVCSREHSVPIVLSVPGFDLSNFTFLDYCGCRPEVLPFAVSRQCDRKKKSIGKLAIAKHPLRKPSGAQPHYSGQPVASHAQDVCTGQRSAASAEGRSDPQVVSGGSPGPSHFPLTPRQPPESMPESPVVERQRPQEKSDSESQSPESKKKPPS